MNRIAFLLCAVILVAPFGAAEWHTFGSYEPDTPYDGFAREDPNQSDRDKLYFNVVLEGGAWGYVNPNAGVLPPIVNPGETHARLLLPAPVFGAYLGLWRDCNRDGYVGSAKGALTDYRAEEPHDRNICPDGGPNAPNDGWIHEFRWIVRDGHVDPWAILDTSARVWGDIGLPGQPHPAGWATSAPTVHTSNDYVFDTPAGTAVAPLSSSATPWMLVKRPTGVASIDPVFFNGQMKPAGARHFTFYATVRTADLPFNSVPDTGGLYGQDWCGANDYDVMLGFDCNPDHWSVLTDLDGKILSARPFDAYQMRDVDCYDQTLAPGVGTSTFSEDPPCQ